MCDSISERRNGWLQFARYSAASARIRIQHRFETTKILLDLAKDATWHQREVLPCCVTYYLFWRVTCALITLKRAVTLNTRCLVIPPLLELCILRFWIKRFTQSGTENIYVYGCCDSRQAKCYVHISETLIRFSLQDSTAKRKVVRGINFRTFKL